MTSSQYQNFIDGKMVESWIMKLFLVCLFTISLLQVVKCESIRIVEPYPANIYPIEGETASITCVAEGKTDEVRFARRTPSGQMAKYPESQRVYTYNYTKGDKIFFTLNFKEIKIEDDSTVERYECWAHKIGDNTTAWDHSAKHGFTVIVIRKSSLPTITPDSPVIMEKNLRDTFSISCNISIPDRPLDVEPLSIQWLKNNVRKQTLCADEGKFQASLKPLVFSSVAPEDGGNYTCNLKTKLKRARPYNIIGGPYVIKIRPTFTGKNLDDNEVIGNKGKSANFSCTAVGFPLTVKWEMKLGNKKIWKHVVSQENDTRYQIIVRQEYEAPNLKISDIQHSDGGLYRCCIVQKHEKGQCQKFVLRIGNTNVNRSSRLGIGDRFFIVMCIAYFCFFFTI